MTLSKIAFMNLWLEVCPNFLANLIASLIIIGLSSLVWEISYNAKYKIDNSIPPILENGIFENTEIHFKYSCSKNLILWNQ